MRTAKIEMPPAKTALRIGLRAAAALLGVGAITVVFNRVFPVNATTVGFIYLVVILVVATGWGFIESTVASVAAMLCLNYFFLPPVGQFTIADPQNWVALFAFLATSLVASRLSTITKRQAEEAIHREQDIEKLYSFSRAILLIDAEPVGSCSACAAGIASVRFSQRRDLRRAAGSGILGRAGGEAGDSGSFKDGCAARNASLG